MGAAGFDKRLGESQYSGFVTESGNWPLWNKFAHISCSNNPYCNIYPTVYSNIMRLNILFAFAICSAGAIEGGAIAAKSEPISLEPSSSWTLDYADDSCRLIRKFGENDDNIILILNSFAPGDEFNLTVAGNPVAYRGASRTASIQFGPGESEQKLKFSNGKMADGMPALIFAGRTRIAPLTESEDEQREAYERREIILAPISEKRKAAVTQLSIGKPLARPISLRLGAMDRPLAALATCVDELMTHWGIDVAKHQGLTRPVQPDGDPGQWVQANDYPSDMLWAGKQAYVHFRMGVDENGDPTACHIQHSIGGEAFDKAVCASLMKRAKFLPALDKAGKPIASFYLNAVNFQIPSF